MSFRISTKNFFITYPQCAMTKQDFVQHWKTNWLNKTYDYVCISRELHADGHPHYHVFVQFKNRLDVKRQDYFDIGTFHPNIQAAKSDKPASDYVKKDGDFWEDGTLIPFAGERGRKRKEDINEECWELLQVSATKQEFLDNVKRHCTRDAIMNWRNIEYFAAKHYHQEEPEYVPTFANETFTNVPQICLDWYNDNVVNFTGPGRPKSLFLCGPTRIGKTAWARSLGKHIYWNNCLNIKTFKPDADYLVVDDIEWKRFHNWKGWLGGQEQFEQAQKYLAPTSFKWNKPTIWCSNINLAAMGILSEHVSWIQGNCICVYLGENDKFY